VTGVPGKYPVLEGEPMSCGWCGDLDLLDSWAAGRVRNGLPNDALAGGRAGVAVEASVNKL